MVPEKYDIWVHKICYYGLTGKAGRNRANQATANTAQGKGEGGREYDHRGVVGGGYQEKPKTVWERYTGGNRISKVWIEAEVCIGV